MEKKWARLILAGQHNTHATVSFHSTLALQAGDYVDVTTDYYDGGNIYDSSNLHFTHFSGWLLVDLSL